MTQSNSGWDDDTAAAFFSDYANGAPWREMVDKYALSMSCLMRKARDRGLPRRTKTNTQWAKDGGWMRPWVLQRDELENLASSGYSEVEIAERLRRTRDGVRHELCRLGYPSSYAVNTTLYFALESSGMGRSQIRNLIGFSVGTARTAPGSGELETLKQLAAVGASNAIIAAALDVQLATVFRWRREYEVRRVIEHRIPSRGRMARKDANARILPDSMGGVL